MIRINKWPFVCLLSLAVGAGIGGGARGADGREANAERPRERGVEAGPADAPASVPNTTSALSADDHARLAMIVRAECSAAVRKELGDALSNRSAAAAAATTVPEPVTAERLAQRSAALAEIDTLLNADQFSAQDQSRFHADLASLDPGQRAEALNRFGSAVSSGRMKFQRGAAEP